MNEEQTTTLSQISEMLAISSTYIKDCLYRQKYGRDVDSIERILEIVGHDIKVSVELYRSLKK